MRDGVYCLPLCESCGQRTEDVVDLPGEVICWECQDLRRQSQADRDYDYERDRRMEGGR